MPPCRVLHVITSLDQGGSEGYLRQLAPLLLARGIEQQVVSMVSGGVHAAGLRDAGIPVTELGMRRGLPDPRGLWTLRKVIADFRPNLIQGWLYHANLLALAANSIPRFSFKAVPKPALLWGIRSAEMDQSRYGLGLRIAVGASARLSRFADCIVANSEAGRADHVRLGFAPECFDVIPNSIDTERFVPDAHARESVRRELGIAPDAQLAGVFARNDPMKNLPQIVAGVGEVPDLEAIFAGVGTEKMAPTDRCHFLGVRSDVPRLMAACDFTVLASKSEGFPNVVAESLACGVPVVTANVGDAAAILGEAGCVFECEDWQGFACCLKEMASMTPERRSQLGVVGRRRVVSRYSADSSVGRFLEVYSRFAC